MTATHLVPTPLSLPFVIIHPVTPDLIRGPAVPGTTDRSAASMRERFARHMTPSGLSSRKKWTSAQGRGDERSGLASTTIYQLIASLNTRPSLPPFRT